MADEVVNEPVDAGTTTTESTPVDNTPEVAEVSPVQKDNGELIRPTETDETKGTEAETSNTEEPEETNTEPEQPQDTEPVAPKSQNRFQQLANDNRQLKAELEQLRAREAQLAQEQELLNEVNPETGEYYTPQEIERIAFQNSRQQQAAQVSNERYELEVQTVQSTLRDDASRALADFPMFDETSKQYDPVLAAKADALLGKNLVIETDAEGKSTGRIIGSNVSPYELYQTMHDTYQSAKTAGQITGQRATEKMLASVDSTGSNQKGETSFDKLSVDEMAARLRRAGHDV